MGGAAGVGARKSTQAAALVRVLADAAAARSLVARPSVGPRGVGCAAEKAAVAAQPAAASGQADVAGVSGVRARKDAARFARNGRLAGAGARRINAIVFYDAGAIKAQ